MQILEYMNIFVKINLQIDLTIDSEVVLIFNFKVINVYM